MSTHEVAVSLIGSSPAIQVLRQEVGYASRCDAKVLITGESGVGKEIVASLIHAGSRRSHHPLVTVNCAAVTESLLESELFGHVRGAFTGAMRDRSGLLEQAHRGTIFMDEVGEMTPRMQGLLLRFFETGEIQRVGSDRMTGRVDVRVIAATNRNLVDAVAARAFRDDLYYRLNVIQLHLPPLRERAEDVPALMTHFLESFARQYAVPVPALSEDAVEALASYTWPGNVRELKNVAEGLVVREHPRAVQIEDLPAAVMSLNVRPSVRSTAPAAPARADRLFDQLLETHDSFWSVVYGPFMARDLTRADIRALVSRGLEKTSGNYRLLTELFNMPAGDYKRFLGFLRKHHCHVAFQQFRTLGVRDPHVSVDAQTRGTAERPWEKSVPA